MDFLDYNDVAMEYRGAMMDGRLKLTDEKVVFKSATKSGKAETIERNEIEFVNWQRLAGTWGIRIFTKNGILHRFAGFKDSERDKLARFFKHSYDMEMLDKELSVKGHNWGNTNFEGGLMTFEIGKADGFEVPLSYVNQCISGKNEATLEFHLNDDAAVNLSEMRFYIPGSELAGDDPVETFREKVMSRASVVTTSGDAIAIFREISCLSPRGRYDIKIFPTYIHLHGKTFDYKIPGDSVMRLFLLPHKDQRQMHFAVNLDPPIKQGQTRYHFLVFNFKMEDEEEIELPFTDEELQEKFDGKLEREINGPTYEVISKILKAVVQKKITVPGSFIGHNGTPALTCSHKAASGFIYPLERGLIFIYKPPIFLRYDEIKSVVFERSGGSTRSFDISVSTKNDISYTFSSIEKNEYGKLYEFMKSKKVNVKTSGKGDGGTLNWDDDNKVDHYLENVKRDAEEMSGEDSMSSDDTDFNPDALEALSAKEEYDSEPSSTSSDSDGEANDSEAEKRREERKTKKEEKAKRAAKRSASKSGGGEKKERKSKRTKLPGQPKRPMSAYFLWMNESREQIKKDHPGLSIAEFGKKAGELWKSMTDKSEWEERAAEDKQRYDVENKNWLESGGAEAIKAAKKEAKAAKRASKAGGDSKKVKSSSKVEKSNSSVNLTSAGSGGGFKSKEFIESESSSGGDNSSDDEEHTKKKSKGKKQKAAKKEAKSSSDEEMKSEKSDSSAGSSD
eukprot:06629.XXX_36124_33230_1 [CDS] Oithona nana genome sequencing.